MLFCSGVKGWEERLIILFVFSLAILCMKVGFFLLFFLVVLGQVGVFSFRVLGVGGVVKRVALWSLRGEREGVVLLLGSEEGG